VKTIYRGTLRKPDFCQGWDVFVELGLTDDSYVLENSSKLTPRQLLNGFLPYEVEMSVEDKLKRFLRADREHLFVLFEEIGFFNQDATITTEDSSPAWLLQTLLQKAWKLSDNDRDMIVMYHEIEFIEDNIQKRIVSSMVSLGEDVTYTAMSNTVGLPIAIIAKLMLNGYSHPGVHIPVSSEIYKPVLNELQEYGITFNENEFPLT
jgi:saccharopine dehydrogenase-like NADP-dependent oxidoreductase